MAKYTYKNGVFTFPHDSYVLRLSGVNQDRYQRIHASAVILTPDEKAYLAQDRGDVTSGQFRARLAAQAAQRNSGNPLDIENFLMDASLALMQDPNVVSVASPPAFRTIGDFVLGVPAPGPEIVEGLLEQGGVYSFGSKPKVGKSILAFNLAFSVAGGSDWLGRRTTKGDVAVFQLEDSARTIKRRIELMTNGQLPHNVFIHAEPFRLTEENYDATVAACMGLALVITDPIIQASNVQDWNSPAEVRAAYEYWRRLARDTDAVVLLLAHHRKMEGDDGDQIAGSNQAQAAVDGMIELFRDRNLERIERRVSFTGRDWMDLPDEVIRLDTETLFWMPNGSYEEARAMAKEMAIETARAGKAQDREAEVLEILSTGPPGKTYAEIESDTGLGKNIVRDAIKNLRDRIQSGGKPRSPTDPQRFWK